MFISRKKFNEAIEKAQKQTEEKFWRQICRDRFEERIEKRMCDLEMRMNRIDSPCQPIQEEKCVAPARY